MIQTQVNAKKKKKKGRASYFPNKNFCEPYYKVKNNDKNNGKKWKIM